ncbi:GNAT family N-acetyltransferase [Roseomonas sp. 18066]|uniref:GNAT family N-acetyltransferase n=1 Tax=Roseomonas sp. 18066 TaxID=2681412 RepID=UPI00135A69AC|nr:GNAT family N-acetyltransferase [Roseomonas sp. 18066]
MTGFTLRPVAPAEQPALLALNNRHDGPVNALTPEAFAGLCADAFLAIGAWDADGALLGLMVALGDAGPVHGPNHGWIRAHHPEAVYIDRIVVEPAAQGQGLGRALYGALAAAALDQGKTALGCEVNLDPPNPESLAFHARLGFAPAGEARDPRNGKLVRYLLADAAPLAALNTAHFLRSPAKRSCPAAPR